MKTIWLWKLSLASVIVTASAFAPRLGLADGVEDILKKPIACRRKSGRSY